MPINITCKKTIELSDTEIAEIYDLFFLIFEKRRPTHLFSQQFKNTSRGYSYHALAFDGERIVGHNVYIPFDYTYDNQPFPIAISVDAMVHPHYRGQGIYEKIAAICEKAAKQDGCQLRLGFPNENSYPIQIKKFNYTHIGELSTYCLPIKISAFKPSLKYFDWVSKFFASSLIGFSKLNNDQKYHVPLIAAKRSEYYDLRLKWFDAQYKTIDSNSCRVVYKVDDFKGIKAAFILDVHPLTSKNFDQAVRCVYNQVKALIPFILYVGNLPFTPLSMIKIPEKISPKNFHVVGKTLNGSTDNRWKNLDNWSLNLSSFDLL